MASAEVIALLRRKIGESDEDTYTDEDLSALLDAASDDTDTVASAIWSEKASDFAELVDISEAGSSRKNSQLMKNAQEMAVFYGAKNESDILVPGRDRPTTRAIVRPS
jgi:hypothetical protein